MEDQKDFVSNISEQAGIPAAPEPALGPTSIPSQEETQAAIEKKERKKKDSEAAIAQKKGQIASESLHGIKDLDDDAAQALVLEDVKKQEQEEASRQKELADANAAKTLAMNAALDKYLETKQGYQQRGMEFKENPEMESMLLERDQQQAAEDEAAVQADQAQQFEEQQRQERMQRHEQNLAQQQAAKENAQINQIKENEIKRQQNEKEIEDSMIAEDVEEERRMQSMRNKFTNFSEFWESRSTGEKILAGIAMLFGSAGGRGNSAVAVINNAIDNNIKQMQEANKINQQDYWRQKEFDLKKVDQELKRRSQATQDQRLKMQMEQARFEMQKQAQEARRQRMLQETIKAGKLTKDQLAQLPRERQDVAVVMPDESIQFAVNKASADDLRKYRNDTEPAVETLNDMIEMVTGAEFSRLSIEDRRRLSAMQQELAGSLRTAIVGPGALTEKELDLLLNTVGDANKFMFQGAEIKKAQDLRNRLNKKIRMRFKNAGVSPPVKVGGKMYQNVSVDAINNALVKELQSKQKGLTRQAAEKELKKRKLWAN